MARRFTLRKNGQQMTTFRIRVDLSAWQIDDLIGRVLKRSGEEQRIEDVLYHCLNAGMDRLTLDSSLDPDLVEAAEEGEE